MNKLIPLLLTLTTLSPAATRLLRTPSVSSTKIAFAYANNIWTVDRAGGPALRITTFQGQTQNPHFSPDGKWLAFSAEYAGNTNFYVVSADAGEPNRLTWHPGPDLVQGWTPDGKTILFTSARATDAPSAAPRSWTVPADGGIEEPLPLPRGYQGKYSPAGTHLAYRMNNSLDDQRRNYRGGQDRPILIVELKSFNTIILDTFAPVATRPAGSPSFWSISSANTLGSKVTLNPLPAHRPLQLVSSLLLGRGCFHHDLRRSPISVVCCRRGNSFPPATRGFH